MGVKEPWRCYKILDLCEDSQNGSFIEKVVLQKEAVAKICNDFIANSCNKDASKIHFDKLDAFSHKCYGIFGHRSSILRFLVDNEILAKVSTDSEKKMTEFPNGTGLYAFMTSQNFKKNPKMISENSGIDNNGSTTILVLWPQEDAFENICPSNKTTTFVRYLTSLCDTVQICLDKNCAENFPRDRKLDNFSRFYEYNAERKTVQEEFSMFEGFQISLCETTEKKPHFQMLIEESGGAFFVTGFPCKQQTTFKTFYQKLDCKGKYSGEIQNLANRVRIKVDQMSKECRKIFFTHFSDDCRKCIEELDEEIKTLDIERDEKCSNFYSGIEKSNPSRKDVKIYFQQKMSKLIEPIWPDLCVSMLPDVPENELNEREKRLFSGSNSNIDEDFYKNCWFKNEFSFQERLCLCFAYFLDSSEVKISLRMVRKCVRSSVDELQELSQQTSYFFFKKYSEEKWSSLMEKVIRILESDLLRKEILRKNDVRTNALLRFLHLVVNEELEKMVSCFFTNPEYNVPEKKRKFKGEMDGAYQSKKSILMEKKLEEAHRTAFGVDVGAAVFENNSTNLKLSLILRSCKMDNNRIILEGDMEEVAERMVKYEVKRLEISQDEEYKIEEIPLLNIHPRPTHKGIFFLPEKFKIVWSWGLERGKIVLITKNITEKELTNICIVDLKACGKWWIMKVVKRDVDQTSFDDSLRLLALYNCETEYVYDKEKKQKVSSSTFSSMENRQVICTKSILTIYRFDERYSHIDQACSPFDLCDFEGEANIQNLTFIRGCHRLAILDTSNRIRFYDIRRQSLVQEIVQLENCIFPVSLLSMERGSCFVVVSKKCDSPMEVNIWPFIGESYTQLPSVCVKAYGDVTWNAITIGAKFKQNHLCAYDESKGILKSQVVKVSGLEQSFDISLVNKDVDLCNEQDEDGSLKHLCPLEYIFYVYDKFPSNGTVPKTLCNGELYLDVVFHCDSATFEKENLERKVKDYVDGIWVSLLDTKKPMENLYLPKNLVVTHYGCSKAPSLSSEGNDNNPIMNQFKGSSSFEQIGKWFRKLICLVPLQIARAEDNEFRILVDGVLIPDRYATNVHECVQNIKLGLFGAIFSWWSGPVLVVSSMGKQSTGKSYTLNHLFGCSFEISGARCTDGCWMTLVETETVLYVVLDFEGLGSFERTYQDDMLLSVFNASLSGLTIFKTEFRIDRDIEQTFAKFQAGVGLIKGDRRLFKGMFCIANKDVVKRDVVSVVGEFRPKIGQIMAGDKDHNFISVMYNNEFSIFPFPPLGERSYYNELHTIEKVLQKRPVQFSSGKSFEICMKTVMAKMHLKDWQSLDRNEIELRLKYLQKHVDIAFRKGRISEDDMVEEDLVCLDDQKLIPDVPLVNFFRKDHPLIRSASVIDLPDIAIVFMSEETMEKEITMNKFLALYEDIGRPRKTQNHKSWHSEFSEFVNALVMRRISRVQEWAKRNVQIFNEQPDSFSPTSGEETKSCHSDEEVARFLDQVDSLSKNLTQNWEICKSACSSCFLRCLLTKGHSSITHSCMGNHKCEEFCLYCQEERKKPKTCMDKNGHHGNHDCRVMQHTCQELCHLRDCLNCNGNCSKPAGHMQQFVSEDDPDSISFPNSIPVVDPKKDEHLCNAVVHLCGKECSAFNCHGKCQIVHGKDHSVHKCLEGFCTQNCAIPGCRETCAAKDHYHGSPLSKKFISENGGKSSPINVNLDLFDGLHFCGQWHPCPNLCESKGICKVTVQRVQEEIKEFAGERGAFLYRTVSEENGEKLQCCIKIPPFSLKHSGSHIHSSDPKVVHFCDEKCPTCLYFCNKPYRHHGRHSASHGMMRNCYFVAESPEIDVGPRKYMVGESGKAEMCDMFCRTLGRGHIHILPCDSKFSFVCTHASQDGRRHETCKYGPDEEKEKDELTHECYWAGINWQDPCSALEQDEFRKCGCKCNHSSHFESGASTSFCTLDLWHNPLSRLTNPTLKPKGILSSDGHLYECSHTGNDFHIVFVLDGSGSMIGQPWKDLELAVESFISTRLSQSFHDLVSIVVYSNEPKVVCESEPILNCWNISLPFIGDGTDFSKALKETYNIISRVQQNSPSLKPLLLFLSDGQCHNGEEEIKMIRGNFQIHELVLHTVAFGNCNSEKLQNLAILGGGNFHNSITGVDLKNTFDEVASKMDQKVSLLTYKGDSDAILSIMSRCGIRVQAHRAARKAVEKESLQFQKIQEEMANQVSSIRRKSTNLEEFLGFVGIQVVGGRIDIARKIAFQKFHPDKNGGAPMEQRAFCEEVIKMINGKW